VACVSGEEEIEGISEKVSGMKKKKDKIDVLLQCNTAKQMADVDWDDLNAVISTRLDKTQQIKASATGFPAVFKIAAATVAAAVFIIVMFGPTDEKGSATVAIINPSDRAHVQVNIVETDGKQGECDIQIIDSSTTRKQDYKARPNWFVIGNAGIASTKNGFDRDVRDIVCLF
jgi:hypothetical protein